MIKIAVPLTLLFVCAALPLDLFSIIIPDLLNKPGFNQYYINHYVQFYLIGFAIGQLMWGSISDHFGRRPVILFTLICILILNSVFLVLPGHFERTIVRFLTGLCAAAGLCLPRAIFRDISSGSKMAILSSWVTMLSECFMTLCPILVGSLIFIYGIGAKFDFITGLVIANLVSVYFWLPETYQPKAQSAFSLRALVHRVGQILQHSTFLTYMTLAGLCYFILMFYLTSGSLIWVKHFHLTIQQWTPLHSIVLSGLIWGSLINQFILRYVAIHKTIVVALVISVLCTTTLPLTLVHPYFFTAVMLGVMTSMGTLFSNCLAKALEPVTHEAGLGSSLYGFLQIIIALILLEVVQLFIT